MNCNLVNGGRLQTLSYQKTVSYTAGSYGYDSIMVDNRISPTNIRNVTINTSQIGNISGLQFTPCYYNGAGAFFYMYYAPAAVSGTFDVIFTIEV